MISSKQSSGTAFAAHFRKSEVTRVFWQATNMPFEASFFSRTSLFGLREWAKPLVLGKVDSLHATQIANDAAT